MNDEIYPPVAGPNDEWRRTAKRRSQPAVSIPARRDSSLPLKRVPRIPTSPEFPCYFVTDP
jgi:hypothetical protein